MSDFMLDFVGVGPQRTGSTWLDRVLRPHPGLCLPKDVKETKFFDQYFDKGAGWYAWHFQHCPGGALRGEVAPTYLDAEHARNRLYKHNPNCKVIVSLRDPAERAFSLYGHHRREGRVPADFWAASRKVPRIIEAGHYARYVSGWLDTFGREQVFFVLLDDVKDRPAWVLGQLCAFLGVEAISPSHVGERVNATTRPRFPWLARAAVFLATKLRGRRLHRVVEWGKKMGLKSIYTGKVTDTSKMAFGERGHLVEMYETDIQYVEKTLGRALPSWRAMERCQPHRGG